MCSEGDPFSDKDSVYYKDAMAAQVQFAEQQERKAALHQAAVKRVASLQPAASTTPETLAGTDHAHDAKQDKHFS